MILTGFWLQGMAAIGFSGSVFYSHDDKPTSCCSIIPANILSLRMKSIIIGTAGHIDHGKTALVKALTGIDADRLQEEKRRGITIDLGFAHLELPGSDTDVLRFGFVDVPGHERFVRNMLAGVGGIDLVLLVVAADEGIKPQTREHFDICRLLAIQRGITVLTKSDLVDPDTLEVVRLEIEDFLRGSFLERSPIIPVSSLKGAGLDKLKRELVRIAGNISARDSNAIARLPIDRVFTMKGFGTIVTGTLVAGTIQKDHELEIFPSSKRVRVRGVQVHGSVAERAIAGERTALNLVGVEKDELQRGMSLSQPGLLQTTSRVDVKLSLLPSAKALKKGSRVHLHAFTSEAIATVRQFVGVDLPLPGSAGFAHFHLSRPMLLVPGDRFIIRQFSPVMTIGGGMVLDAVPMPFLKPEIRHRVAQVTESGDPAEIVGARIGRRWSSGITLQEVIAETGWPTLVAQECLSRSVNTGVAVKAGSRFVYVAAITALKLHIIQMLQRFHDKNPLSTGMQQETLREQVNAGGEAFAFALDALAKESRIEIAGEQIRLPGHGVVMKDEEVESRKIIETAFASAGLKVPALKDVLAGLKIDRTRAQKIMTLLLRDKTLVKVSDELVFHRSALEQLRQDVVSVKQQSPKINVARFKDLTGVSRKYAIPLLEYLDRERVTKRVGDERLIL
jgi:selenocysteine-specific elongation factor